MKLFRYDIRSDDGDYNECASQLAPDYAAAKKLIVTRWVCDYDLEPYFGYTPEERDPTIDNFLKHNAVCTIWEVRNPGHHQNCPRCESPGEERDLTWFACNNCGWLWHGLEDDTLRAKAEQAVKDDLSTVDARWAEWAKAALTP